MMLLKREKYIKRYREWVKEGKGVRNSEIEREWKIDTRENRKKETGRKIERPKDRETEVERQIKKQK